MTKGPNFKLVMPADGNDIFQALPYQIYALRQAMGLSKTDFAAYLLIGEKSLKDKNWSQSISNWEKGRTKPHLVYRVMMSQLSLQYKAKYTSILKKITTGPKQDLYVPIVKARERRNPKKSVTIITQEEWERINARDRSFDCSEAVDQGDGGVGEANGEAECPPGEDRKCG